MNKNEEILRLWSETNREGDRENVRRKRPAESMRERKMNRVKRQCVSKFSHKSNHNLSEKTKQRDIIRSKLETLKQITPNCPKSDISSILDSVIEYMRSLQFAVFLTVLQNSV